MDNARSVCAYCQQAGATAPPPDPDRTVFVPPVSKPAHTRHSRVTAITLALMLIVAGHFYNRQPAKAFLLLVVYMTLLVGAYSLETLAGAEKVVYAPAYLLYFGMILDAGYIAGRIKHGEQVGPWQCF